MKTYSVNVHYDYCVNVSVKAKSEEEAIMKAKEIAEGIPQNEMEYCDFIDACIV